MHAKERILSPTASVEAMAAHRPQAVTQLHLLAQANHREYAQIRLIAQRMRIGDDEFNGWAARLLGITPRALNKPSDLVFTARTAETVQLLASPMLSPEQIIRLRTTASALFNRKEHEVHRAAQAAHTEQRSVAQDMGRTSPSAVLQQLKNTTGLSKLPDAAKTPNEFAIAAKRLAQRNSVPELRQTRSAISVLLVEPSNKAVAQDTQGELLKAAALHDAALKVPQFVFALPTQRDREIRGDFGSLTTGGKVTAALARQHLSYKVVSAFSQGPPGSLVGKAMFLEGHQVARGEFAAQNDDRKNMTTVQNDYSTSPGPGRPSNRVYGYRDEENYTDIQAEQLRANGVLLNGRPAFSGERIGLMLREKFLGTNGAAGTGRPDYIYLSVCFSGSTRACDIAPRIAQLTGVPVVAPVTSENSTSSVGATPPTFLRGTTRYTSDGKIKIDGGRSQSHMVVIYPDGSHEQLPDRIPGAGISLPVFDQSVRQQIQKKGFGLQ
jgi:hypothetical protein